MAICLGGLIVTSKRGYIGSGMLYLVVDHQRVLSFLFIGNASLMTPSDIV